MFIINLNIIRCECHLTVNLLNDRHQIVHETDEEWMLDFSMPTADLKILHSVRKTGRSLYLLVVELVQKLNPPI